MSWYGNGLVLGEELMGLEICMTEKFPGVFSIVPGSLHCSPGSFERSHVLLYVLSRSRIGSQFKRYHS